MRIKTSVYESSLDIAGKCRGNAGQSGIPTGISGKQANAGAVDAAAR
jgi:hypothetical protein